MKTNKILKGKKGGFWTTPVGIIIMILLIIIIVKIIIEIAGTKFHLF